MLFNLVMFFYRWQ